LIIQFYRKALEYTFFRLPSLVNSVYMPDAIILHFGLTPSERQVPNECKDRCPNPNTLFKKEEMQETVYNLPRSSYGTSCWKRKETYGTLRVSL